MLNEALVAAVHAIGTTKNTLQGVVYIQGEVMFLQRNACNGIVHAKIYLSWHGGAVHSQT